MSETLTSPETKHESAIEALRLIQDLDFPKTRDQLPGFLYDMQITDVLKVAIEECGKKREGRENLNHLKYPSIVRGELVTARFRKADFFFAALYTADGDEQPNKIGIYRKHEREPHMSYGLNLPINEDGSFDIATWMSSPYARSTRKTVECIKAGAAGMQAVIEAGLVYDVEPDYELIAA